MRAMPQGGSVFLSKSFADLDDRAVAELAKLRAAPRRVKSDWFGVCAPARVAGQPCLALLTGYWVRLRGSGAARPGDGLGAVPVGAVLMLALFDESGRALLGQDNDTLGPILGPDEAIPSAREAKSKMLRRVADRREVAEALEAYGAVRERWAIEAAAPEPDASQKPSRL